MNVEGYGGVSVRISYLMITILTMDLDCTRYLTNLKIFYMKDNTRLREDMDFMFEW